MPSWPRWTPEAPREPRGAVFCPRRRYRYLLWRTWDRARPAAAFFMLNPSTADACADDPTIRACTRIAAALGFGTALVANLFAYCATDPGRLGRARDPVGPENDAAITAAAVVAHTRIAAWGNHGALHGRADIVASRLRSIGPLHCLGLTASGLARHPLYLPTLTPLVPYPASRTTGSPPTAS